LCPLMFFNNTSTPASYRLSLHDALPISGTAADCRAAGGPSPFLRGPGVDGQQVSARSSHAGIQPLLGAARARIETHRRLPRRFGPVLRGNFAGHAAAADRRAKRLEAKVAVAARQSLPRQVA